MIRRSHSRTALSTLAAFAAACNSKKPDIPTLQPPLPASNAHVEFPDLQAQTLGITKEMTCPLTLHFEGAITVSGASGEVRYRWERGDGHLGDVHTAKIPAPKDTVPGMIKLEPDEWKLTSKDAGGTFTDRVHVLSPTDRMSPVQQLMAGCK